MENACHRILACQIRSLVPDCEVFDDGWTTVLERNDVINMKHQRISNSMKVTVFAATLRSLARPSGRGPGSRMRLVLFPPQGHPSLGLHDSEQIPDVELAIKFSPFFLR